MDKVGYFACNLRLTGRLGLTLIPPKYFPKWLLQLAENLGLWILQMMCWIWYAFRPWSRWGFLQQVRIVHKHSLPIDPVLASFVGSDATEPILILNTFLQRDRQSGEQVGGSRLVNEYRAKYMSFTFASWLPPTFQLLLYADLTSSKSEFVATGRRWKWSKISWDKARHFVWHAAKHTSKGLRLPALFFRWQGGCKMGIHWADWVKTIWLQVGT